MKFIHIADCHIGGYKDPKLRELSLKAFTEVVNRAIKENVDFVLIAGDLFNTSLPPIDILKEVVVQLKRLKDVGIDVYGIAGSHDFSPSGKTIIDVLESAGLFVNVVRGNIVDGKLRLSFTEDKKTNVKITGMLGRKGSLEKRHYENLLMDNLEKEAMETGFKIFMFHSAITELKPKELEKMQSSPVSMLPKNFNYYAGGHVHIVNQVNLPDYQNVVYPGPLFPNNFAELEKLGCGGFYIFDNDQKLQTNKLRYEKLELVKVKPIKFDCSHKNAFSITLDILDLIKDENFENTIVLLRLFGTLESSKPSDVDFKQIFGKLYEKNAYFVMKNTNKLTSKEFEEIKIKSEGSTQDIENSLINEHSAQIQLQLGEMDKEKEKQFVAKIMRILDTQKDEGEKVTDFENRIEKETDVIFNLLKS